MFDGVFHHARFVETGAEPEQIDLRIITGLEVIEVSLLDYAAWPDTRVAVLRPTARPKPARVHQTESFDFDVEQAICAFSSGLSGVSGKSAWPTGNTGGGCSLRADESE